MNQEQAIHETQEQLRQLRNHQTRLKNLKSVEERKARTRRLIQRGAILESVFPALREASNEAVQTALITLSATPEGRKLRETQGTEDGKIT